MVVGGRDEIRVWEIWRRRDGYDTMRRRSMYIGEVMPDLSLKVPNLTAEISWSCKTRDSIDDGGGDDIIFERVKYASL